MHPIGPPFFQVCSALEIVHPHTHDALEDALKTADCALWVWPPDQLKCDAIDWSDHRGAARIGRLLKAGGAPNVQWVHASSHGVDHLPLDSFPDAIQVTNSRGAFALLVAEFVIGSCFHWAKAFPEIGRAQQQHRWVCPQMTLLRGQIVGIIGYGSIGREVARLAGALGMRCVALRRKHVEEGGMVEVRCGTSGLESLLAESDYVVISAPFTPKTEKLVGEGELAKMKPSAVLINVGRGGIVDEAALIKTLQAGAIKGAILEVFNQEPLPEDSPFYNLNNCVVAAHCADNSANQFEPIVQLIEENANRFVCAQPLRNAVDKTEGY